MEIKFLEPCPEGFPGVEAYIYGGRALTKEVIKKIYTEKKGTIPTDEELLSFSLKSSSGSYKGKITAMVLNENERYFYTKLYKEQRYLNSRKLEDEYIRMNIIEFITSKYNEIFKLKDSTTNKKLGLELENIFNDNPNISVNINNRSIWFKKYTESSNNYIFYADDGKGKFDPERIFTVLETKDKVSENIKKYEDFLSYEFFKKEMKYFIEEVLPLKNNLEESLKDKWYRGELMR